MPLKSLDLAHLCGISESLILEELIFRAIVRLVRSFTGVKSQTSLTGRDFVPKSLLLILSFGKNKTDISGKDFKGFLGG